MTNIQDMLTSIRQAFIQQDKYLFDKHVPEFKVGDKFLGDCFVQIVVEPKGKMPPRFYQNFSPFDVISKQAPDRAVVYENGKLLLDIDFTDEVVTRTAAMDTLVMASLGTVSLKDKNILILGAGKIAQRSLKIMKNRWSDLRKIECLSRTGDLKSIQKIGKEIGVDVETGSLKRIHDYDFILCHTSATETVFGGEYQAKLKKGAVVTTFISSTVHGEIADIFYDTNEANIICDWSQTLVIAKDLARSIESGKVTKSKIILLKDLFKNGKLIDNTKQYTIYRSTGTPIQNLAMLQLKIANQKS